MYTFWPAPATAAQGRAPEAVVRVVHRRGVGHEGVEVVGGLQALRLVEILAVDLERHLAVVRDAEELAVDRVRRAPVRDDVVGLEPSRVGKRGVLEEGVERLDPFVRRVERVVHRGRRVGRVGGGLRGEVDDALLPDLRGGIFSKRTAMPVSASNCGARVIRLSK
jgi:hypothetical protein